MALLKKIYCGAFLSSFFFNLLNSYTPTPLEIIPITQQELQLKKRVKTDWLFIVYIAGDNDLDYFARRNVEEMKLIGSNENITVAVQLDRHGPTQHTKRLFVAKDVLYQVNADDISSQQKLNSGNAQTLIDCCKWAIESYPANHYALVLWNHGTGILDSIRGKTTNPSELFIFNPANHMLELDRSVDFLSFMEHKNKRDPRGVCFSDTYGSYLTNQKLEFALKTITHEILHDKKFDIIAFDACLMAMIEVADLIAPYSNYMVASEEVELGTGWGYQLVLEPFLEDTLTPEQFAQHMVKSYAKRYEPITKDFTQSALKLDQVKALKNNIDTVSNLLLEASYHQLDYSVKKTIRASRSKRACTCFAEPSYIDLYHFYQNLKEAINFIRLPEEHASLIQQISAALQEGLALITHCVLIQENGKNLVNAHGISIYFPLRTVERSYPETPFAQTTQWLNLLRAVL